MRSAVKGEELVKGAQQGLVKVVSTELTMSTFTPADRLRTSQNGLVRDCRAKRRRQNHDV